MILSNRNFPRWLILLIDIVIIIISVFLAYMVRFNFNIPQVEIVQIPEILGYILGVRIISFLVSRTYAGFVRYTSTEDVVKIFVVIIAGSVFFSISNLVSYYMVNEKFFIPFSIIIIDFFATTLGMSFYRILVKVAFLELQSPSKNKTNVVIFGAGESGIISKRALDRDAGTKYKVLAFLDDNEKKVGKKLENISIVSGSELDKTLRNNNVAHLILSVQNLNPARKKEIIETCLENNTRVLNVPPMSKWINGELSFKQIKKINIEDLLERDEIKLDQGKIKNELSGKNVLITGAAGSIGSELVRQIANYLPKNLILVDNAETPLYEIELELGEHPKEVNYEVVLCDIRNKARMNLVFDKFQPNIIFHAAAY
ncbi:MAG: polysaccharide biosynthesis protein, partial [Saprospiraceae bacterium]|nr:polysaccharide biosynthesis protein [Saprospiraceae bacterium]